MVSSFVRRLGPIRASALIAVVALLAIGTARSSNASAGTTFTVHPLLGTPLTDMGKYAIGYTRFQLRVLSGEPQVLLVRNGTRQEFSAVGLNLAHSINQEPPMVLVVLRGDFDISNNYHTIQKPVLDPDKAGTYVHYLAYIFDMYNGWPVLIDGSGTGYPLKKVLDDPSLPDGPDLTLANSGFPPGWPTAAAGPPVVESTEPAGAYGSVIPTVAPPGK